MALTRTPHMDNPGAIGVRTSAGEFLVFVLEAGGPVPNFAQRGTVSGLIINEGRFPDHPKTRYVWNYLRNESDRHNFEVITTGFLFFSNANYRFRVGVFNADGLVRDVMDIEYSGAATDFTDENFTVVLQG